jgi:hypothetical protein
MGVISMQGPVMAPAGPGLAVASQSGASYGVGCWRGQKFPREAAQQQLLQCTSLILTGRPEGGCSACCTCFCSQGLPTKRHDGDAYSSPGTLLLRLLAHNYSCPEQFA